jgi:hypothetical protein
VIPREGVERALKPASGDAVVVRLVIPREGVERFRKAISKQKESDIARDPERGS